MPRGPHGWSCGGQGVAREGESEGLAEQFRAVIEMDEVGRPKSGSGRACTMEAKVYCIPPEGTKVCAGGMERKIFA